MHYEHNAHHARFEGHAHAAATVERLLVELRTALTDCGKGPLRAVIDSDGSAVVQELVGRPMSGTHRIVGTPLALMRSLVGPQMPIAAIQVEAMQ